jgi:hypothetical protein
VRSKVSALVKPKALALVTASLLETALVEPKVEEWELLLVLVK